MVKTKLTTRRLHEKTGNLPDWLVNRQYRKKKINLFFQNKTNTSTKDCKHYQKWISCKNYQSRKKI